MKDLAWNEYEHGRIQKTRAIARAMAFFLLCQHPSVIASKLRLVCSSMS